MCNKHIIEPKTFVAWASTVKRMLIQINMVNLRKKQRLTLIATMK